MGPIGSRACSTRTSGPLHMISLILPAFNPGPIVERTWFAVEAFLIHQDDPWEAVFVLDGCTDGTPELLTRLANTSDPRMRVVSYSPNQGKGHAVRVGLLAARGDYRIFTDVDLAYSFDDVLHLADVLQSGADVAIASREHPTSRMQLPVEMLGYTYRRQLQSRVFQAVARLLLPLSQRDTQAGLKGMTAAVAERLVPELQCNGFGFDCELLTACARSGIEVAETPVCVRYEDTTSTTGLRSALGMLWELWRIRWAWRSKSVAFSTPGSDVVSNSNDGSYSAPLPPAASVSWQSAGGRDGTSRSKARAKRSKLKSAG
jgi:dolichyl-phosphate beta-glucosyltransferase